MIQGNSLILRAPDPGPVPAGCGSSWSTDASWKASDRVRRVPAAAHTSSRFIDSPDYHSEMKRRSPFGFGATGPASLGAAGRRLAVVCCVLVGTIRLSAFESVLDRRAIEQAIFLGQSRFDAERARFHGGYRLVISRPPVDWIDVITPFHRVALAAAMKARLGDRVFGQREAAAALAAAPNLIEFVVELTFHPLNNYVGVPAYAVTLNRGQDKPIAAQSINRNPRFGPRTETGGPALPDPNAAPILGNGQPMLGGTMVVQFAADAIDAMGRYDIVLTDSGKEILRTGVDFGRMR